MADHLAFRWLRRCSFLVSFGRGRSSYLCGNLPSHLLCWFSNSLGEFVVTLASSIFLIRGGNLSPHLLRWIFLDSLGASRRLTCFAAWFAGGTTLTFLIRCADFLDFAGRYADSLDSLRWLSWLRWMLRWLSWFAGHYVDFLDSLASLLSASLTGCSLLFYLLLRWGISLFHLLCRFSSLASSLGHLVVSLAL